MPASSKTRDKRKNIAQKILTGEIKGAIENKKTISSQTLDDLKKIIYTYEKENGFERGELWDEMAHELEDDFYDKQKETRSERRRRGRAGPARGEGTPQTSSKF